MRIAQLGLYSDEPQKVFGVMTLLRKRSIAKRTQEVADAYDRLQRVHSGSGGTSPV